MVHPIHASVCGAGIFLPEGDEDGEAALVFVRIRFTLKGNVVDPSQTGAAPEQNNNVQISITRFIGLQYYQLIIECSGKEQTASAVAVFVRYSNIRRSSNSHLGIIIIVPG